MGKPLGGLACGSFGLSRGSVLDHLRTAKNGHSEPHPRTPTPPTGQVAAYNQFETMHSRAQPNPNLTLVGPNPTQVADYKKFETMQQRCQLCMDSAARPKHLLIALGTAAYLMMPLTKRLMPGHCLIVPMQHCKAIRMADETAATEIRNFKKCLIQMFAKQGKEV